MEFQALGTTENDPRTQALSLSRHAMSDERIAGHLRAEAPADLNHDLAFIRLDWWPRLLDASTRLPQAISPAHTGMTLLLLRRLPRRARTEKAGGGR